MVATGWGDFSDRVDFDPGPNTFVLSDIDAAGRDFLVELDTTGDFRWARRVPAVRGIDEAGITTGPDGAVLLTSFFAGTPDFAPGQTTFPLTAISNRDAYLWKLAPPQDPTGLSLSENRVLEQQPAGTKVGRFSTTDPDPGGAFTYQLVAGSGDADNASFAIHQDILLTAAEFDFATKTDYSIRVRTTDMAGRWLEQLLTIHVQPLATTATAGDRVWNDANGDGVQDAGEPGLSNVVVEVYSAADDLHRGTAVTDGDGQFQVANLLPDTAYYLQFRTPPGYEFTSRDSAGDDATDSDADATGRTESFTAQPGEQLMEWDAGLVAARPDFGFAFGVGHEGADQANAVALDAEGNVYVVGLFEGTVDFDPGPGIRQLTSDGRQSFIAKYTAEGALAWVGRMQGTGSSYGRNIDAPGDGFVYVTGDFSGDLEFSGNGGTEVLAGAGSTDIFVAKLSESGNLVWLKGFVGGAGDALSVVAGPDGSVYTTGHVNNTIDFDPGPDTFYLSYVSSYWDTYVSKLDANGDFVWAKLIAGNGSVTASTINLAADGNIYLAGDFRGTIDFDPGEGVHSLSSYGSYTDAYVLKLNSNGDFGWVRTATGTGYNSVRGLSLASDGGVVTTGSFQYSADFDPGAAQYTLTSESGYDGFLWRLSADGDLVWARQFAGASYVYGQAVEVTGDNSIYLAGTYISSVDVDPGTDTFLLTTSDGTYNTFLSKLDADGQLQWVQHLEVDSTYDLALATDEVLYVVGLANETNPDMDPRSGQYRLVSAGGADAFVARYRTPVAPTDVTLPANRVFEFQPPGTIVGGFVGLDPDAGEQFTYELVPGVGDTDNSSFTVELGQLITADVFDASVKDTFAIRVRATDLSGQSVAMPLTVHVVALTGAAEVSGRMWQDIDANGLRAGDEPPLNSAVAELRTAHDQIPRSTTVVGENGRYAFSGLIPGVDYVVAFRSAAGYDYTLSPRGQRRCPRQ